MEVYPANTKTPLLELCTVTLISPSTKKESHLLHLNVRSLLNKIGTSMPVLIALAES